MTLTQSIKSSKEELFMEILSTALGYVMNFCYKLLHDYGLAIILFTLISKIVLLPVSIWVQKNSIKMVKMQPDINRILIKHYGDKDEIAEEQSKLYKKEKYNPFKDKSTILLDEAFRVYKDLKNAPSHQVR